MTTNDALSNFQEIMSGTEKMYYPANARNMGMLKWRSQNLFKPSVESLLDRKVDGAR
jgi:hypothetical protein